MIAQYIRQQDEKSINNAETTKCLGKKKADLGMVQVKILIEADTRIPLKKTIILSGILKKLNIVSFNFLNTN